MNLHPAAILGWACSAICINTAINGWLIYRGLISDFNYAVQGRAIGSLILIIPCVFFFDTRYIVIDNDNVLITFSVSFLLSLAAYKFNSIRRRSPREARNYAYFLRSSNRWSFHFPEVISWTLYLLPYEFLFRGLLLPYLLDGYNPVVAVVLTFNKVRERQREHFYMDFCSVV